MAKISTETIEEINNRIDIVAIVGEYTRLERRNNNDWWGCCPFHNEKTPSFHVIPDKKMCHCFGCGKGGSAISFYMEMEKLSFTEAIQSLAKKVGVEVVYDGGIQPDVVVDNTKDQYIDLYNRVAGSFHYLLTKTEMGKEALEYLTKRGITEDILHRFQIGYSPADRKWLFSFLKQKSYSPDFLKESGLFSKKYPEISFFSDRVMFPISDRKGQVVAFGGRLLHGDGPKYLNSGDLIQYKKGETLYAFNLAKNAIRNNKSAILCEGYMDVIAYHQAGIENAVAPLGTALTENQIKMLRSFVDTIYLSFDSDGAGRKATYKAILMCRQFDVTVKIIQLSGGKDPADILLNYGAEILTKYVSDAIIDCDYLLSNLSNEYPVDTPEGKTKASLAFFPYLDSLQSDMHKESCFEQLCQTFGLKLEAVKSDYLHRDAAIHRVNKKNSEQAKGTEVQVIKPNAENRAVLAVFANLEAYPLMRQRLSADDLEDEMARDMFIALEECYREDAFSYDSLLSRCNESIKLFVSNAVASGEFSINSEQAIEDSIKLVKRNSLERKRDRLMNKIRSFRAVTLEEQRELELLLNEKMNIDFELKTIKDTN
jgi:DNA primase